MPSDGRKYKAIPRMLSDEDKTFVKLVVDGKMNKSQAFRAAYPNHRSVMRYMDAVKDKEDSAVRTRASMLVTMAAKTKLQTNYIQSAVITYQKKMEQFSELSVETAIDLVQNARSEKVRADLAVEGMRHQVGTPVQKVAVKEERRVIITFGDAPVENVIDIDPES